jgi:acetyl esterase
MDNAGSVKLPELYSLSGRSTMIKIFFLVVLVALGTATPTHAAEDRCPNLAGTPNVAPSPASIGGAAPHTFRTIRGKPLRLHVFAQSESGKARPAVVLFFGGGWMNGTVDQLAPVARHLAERGLVAILADYRTYCRDGADVADEVADANAALIWIRSNARKLGIDPRRIATLGGSSGGHLAASTALFATTRNRVSSRPDLLLLFYPCVDLTSEYELDYSAKAIADHGRALSPIFHQRADLPPMTIFQGSEDPLYAENKRFCSEERQLGANCDWREFAGAGHGFFNPAGPAAAKWMEPAFAALDEVLRTSGYMRAGN